MKKAIVVGGSSGMGLELVKLLADNEYMVAVTGRDEEKLKSTKAYSPQKIIYQAFDLTELRNEECLQRLVDQMKGLDLLVISAGGDKSNHSLDFDPVKKTISLNVLAFAQVISWAYIFFKNQGYGQIAAITSVAGMRGHRKSPAYCSSKSFQIRYLESFRQRIRREKINIDVTEVRPGFVDTEKYEGLKRPWSSSLKKASEQIFTAIRNKRKVAYISKRWFLIGLLIKLLPRIIYDRL